ncbi:MAG: DUF4412 domain-containing protein [Verrucomicrobia bacterium]|nr:DUF4412 domain-containing protein [Verrucomicrobiota bacterium]MCG2679650.1 DUF4412 domain-containing protein [Kiritimatiellia bacterium]MBU4247949.1 DUF4412 domain-containing protein [Verrucomicrobiota bacterium]MBU4291446.1 DUF4412 domain-containing protein [Verrucomicrobiota bacterium]MBU4428374.1 DUF4412 domain-containing protein [Verrucomicrobiota bacterium]
MKFAVILGTVVLSAATIWADMTVVQKVESARASGQPAVMTMTLQIKGSKAKIDFKPEPESSVIDLQTNKIYLIDNIAKRVMVMSLDQMKKAMELAGTAMTQGGKKSFQKTENMKTINGFKCREYTLSFTNAAGSRVTCWMAEDVDAKEMEPFRVFAMDIAKIFGQEAMAQMKGMMIATESSMTFQGKETQNRMEVQSISRDTIDDSVFVVPSDYISMEIPPMPSAPPMSPPQSPPAK